MNIRQLIGIIPEDPVNLSIKGKLLAVFSCFSAILMSALASHALSFSPFNPLLVASIGASAVILFIIPHSPLAQPWPLVGGQLISAIIGIAVTQEGIDTILVSACAVGGSVLAMLLFRCLHPPGAATALAPVMAGDPLTSLGYSFVLIPVGVNVVIMLVMAIVINRWVLGHQYPVLVQKVGKHKFPAPIDPATNAGISDLDLEQALDSLNMFIDITQGDLSKLFKNAQKNSFKRFSGNITCADIMARNVPVVEYGTEVEDAWRIMHNKKLKAMPVIDRSKRVIGIITWNDFFKFVSLGTYETFQDKFRTFIRRTAGVSTDKPEAVGHIMTTEVLVLKENTHIVELIHLMSHQGHRQIPIVDDENRLSGMVSQADLIAAIYHTRLAVNT